MKISAKSVSPVVSLSCAVAMITTASGIAHAADGMLSVGVGAAYGSVEYIGMDDASEPMPIVSYQLGRFTFVPFGVSAVLTSFDWSPARDLASGEIESRYTLSISASAQYANDERDNDDSVIFTGMDIREEGSVAGLSAQLASPIGEFDASVITDISGASEGSVVALGYGFPLYSTSRFAAGARLGLDLADGNWNNYYYGVRDAEASVGRAAYTASASVNPSVQINTSYLINSHWAMIQTASVTQLDDTLIDSPLTTREDMHSEFSLAILYSF